MNRPTVKKGDDVTLTVRGRVHVTGSSYLEIRADGDTYAVTIVLRQAVLGLDSVNLEVHTPPIPEIVGTIIRSSGGYGARRWVRTDKGWVEITNGNFRDGAVPFYWPSAVDHFSDYEVEYTPANL